MKYVKENFIGKRWDEVSSEDQAELLKDFNAIDVSTGNNCKHGDCVFDLKNGLSINGYIEYGEYFIISDDAILYDPEIGI